MSQLIRIVSLMVMSCLLSPLVQAEVYTSTQVKNRVKLLDNSRVEVEIISPMETLPNTGGFLPVEISIKNKSKEDTWEFTFKDSDRYTARNINIKLPITVNEKETYRAWHYIPISIDSSFSIEVSSSNDFESYYRFIDSGYASNRPFTLVSETIGSPIWRELETRLSGGVRGSLVEFSAMPADIRAWMGVKSAWMSLVEWEQLRKAQQDVIHQWILAGGNLYIVSSQNVLSDGDPYNLIPAMGEGLGGVSHIASNENAIIDRIVLSQTDGLYRHFFEIGNAYINTPEYQDIVGLEFPLATVILFLLIFGILIGPVNLLKLADRERRHRLFWTVPLLSVGASITLFLIIILSDGTGGKGMRHGLVLLDSHNNHQWVFEQHISRTGLLLSRSFDLKEETVLAVEENKKQLSIEGEYYSGDWFSSRSLQDMYLQRSETTRTELMFDSNSGEILSSIDAAFDHVFLIDERGDYWELVGLNKGQKTMMSASKENKFNVWMKNLVVSESLKRQVRQLGNTPGYFYAYSNNTNDSALSDTLDSIDWLGGAVIYTGQWTPMNGEQQ